MRTNDLFRAALAGAVALLAACSDSTGSTATGPGSLSFTYAGDRSGSYSANGEFKTSGSSFVKQPFAVGARGTTAVGTSIAMIAYQPVSASTGNMVLIGLPDVSGTGTFGLGDDSCAASDLATCPFAAILFDTNPDLEEDDSQIFAFTSGTLTVTSNTGGHLRGTFSGTAETIFADSTITVTNGAFDVPVRSQSSLSLDRAAARPVRLLDRHAKP